MWARLVTQRHWFLVLGSAVGVYEVVLGGGRPFVLGFAAALLGLRWTLPSDKDNGKD